MQGHRTATRTGRQTPQHPTARRTGAGEEALATLAFLALATAALWVAAAPLVGLATLGAGALTLHAARQVVALAPERFRRLARRTRA